jgi:hypothetical protein
LPKRLFRTCLGGEERWRGLTNKGQVRREAALRELHIAVPLAEFLRCFSKRRYKPGVGLIELVADPLGKGMEAGSR